MKFISNHCIRCGHRWYQRTPKHPKVCPHCNSPYWNTPRRIRKNKL